jgi:uncharacterized protein YdeI (YjbR/CyaY-like superfamily)
MAPADGQSILEFADSSAWAAWLDENQDSAGAVWLKIAKRGASRDTVRYPEVLDTAIAYGWIDGQRTRFDEEFFLQRFSPRGPRSKWSQVNRDKAQALIARGAMRPRGRQEVEAARADGRWQEAYPGQSTATVPEDFQRALDAHPEADRFFRTLTGSRRYAFLYRLHHVKRPEARAKRIAGYIELLSAGKTLE